MRVNLLHFLSVEKSGKRVREKTVGFWEKRVGGSAAAAVYRSWPSNTEVKRCRMRTNIQAAWLVNKAFSSRAQVRRATKVHQFAFFKESSKFLRPLLTYVVVLDFPPSSFFYSLQGGVMESLVSLAMVLVVILCFVHGGIAGKYWRICMKNKKKRTTQDICDDSRSIAMFTADRRPETRATEKGVEKGLTFTFITETKRLRLKQLGYLTIKQTQDWTFR